MRMAVKSIVWYPKAAYEKRRLSTEPRRSRSSADVADKIKADGTTPWCMGWESDQATGWVGTDWLEELVLRIGGPDVYDQWVTHEIPFNDPKIVKALDEFGKIAKTEAGARRHQGHPQHRLRRRDDPGLPGPARVLSCMRQGNFATGFFPEDVQADLDSTVGTFVFPPYEGGYDGQPILGGGDLAATFNGDDDDTKKVMEFLTSDKFGAEWAQAGGWLSPHTTFDAGNYANETTRTIADIGRRRGRVPLRRSDLMPKEVGSGTFWTEMVKWESGQSLQDTLDAIEASWPTS